MSSSLNINTPNIIQQNTPMRNVPSGSTATPDYSVKYVPQELTEEQQAQARQNIGAISASEIPASAQADWNETDTESPAYIKNKPNMSEPDYNFNEDNIRSLTLYLGTNRPPIYGIQGNNKFDKALDNGFYVNLAELRYPNVFNSDGGKVVFNGDITAGQRTEIGKLRFYPDYYYDEIWAWTGVSGYRNANNNTLIGPIFWQDSSITNAHVVLRVNARENQLMAYNINWTDPDYRNTSDKVQHLTVWNMYNRLFNGIWDSDADGDVVFFDNPIVNQQPAAGPSALINFILYVPRNRYAEHVAALETIYGSSTVQDYIVPKIQQYDFISNIGDGKLRMINLG